MTRGDWIILTACATLIGALYAHFWSPPRAAHTVIITAGDTVPQYLDLDHDRDLRISGHEGESHIVIREGRARFVDSTCHDKYCVHYGWLSHAGETIACLPNRVVLQLAGEDPRFDAINF